MTGTPSGPALPDLRVVKTSAIALHEEADERRVRILRQRFMGEQVVKNPPVVAPLEDERFVVLDGANRMGALRELGLPDVLVQVVDYDDVALSTWHHLVAGVDAETLVESVARVNGAAPRTMTLEAARRELAAERLAAYLVTPDGDVSGLGQPRDLPAAVPLLRAIVDTYHGEADIFRVQGDDIEALRPFYSELAALVVFPPFAQRHIRALALRDAKLPTGITRHVIPRRALRLHTRLSVLWSDTPLREKNRWLSEWMRHKLQSGEIRYYEEPTFLFDE